jgi:hypothetical protein
MARRLAISYVHPRDLGPRVDEMYTLFESYYEGTYAERFRQDLSEKDVAVLLTEPATGAIKGFTTVRVVGPKYHHQQCVVMYSGDTVVDREYWGEKSLQVSIQRFITLLRLRTRPWWPVYWMVTSKGFKTYLLVINNLRNAFPRHDLPTPPNVQLLQHTMGALKYGGRYHEDSNTVRFEGALDRVADGVSEPTAADLGNPDIQFFVDQNPNYAVGDELLVLAEFRLRDLVPVATKMAKNWAGLR